MSIIPKLLKSRQRFPKPLANWDFGDASKIQEGATVVDVAGWTDSQVTNQRISGNLVTNGDFATGDTTGWIEGVTPIISVSAGQVTIDRNGAAIKNVFYQQLTTVAGGIYTVIFDVISQDGESKLRVTDSTNTGANLSNINQTTTGKKSITFTALSTTSFIHLEPAGFSFATSVFSNITSYQLNPNTVAYDLTQTTAAAQPVFSTDHIVFDGSDYLEGMPTQSGDFTYIIKFLSTSSATQVILGSSTQTAQFIALSGTSIRYMSSQGVNRDSTLVYANTGPHTAAIVKSGTSLKVYNDGSEIGSFTDTGTVSLDWLGDRIQSSPLPFIGNMYNTLIYPSALTAAEVAAKTASLA